MANELDELINLEGIWIKFFIAKEAVDDPFEKNVNLTYTNPIPVKAIVNDVSLAKISWSMVGVVTDKAKEIVIDVKWKNLLEQSHKIYVDGDYYLGWRQNGMLQYKLEGGYIRAYLYIKKA